MRIKIYKTIFIILLIGAIITIMLIITQYKQNLINEEQNKEVIDTFSKIDEEDSKQLTLNGYNVIGTIEIPKINIKYPILEVENPSPESTKTPMKYSIIKYWGGKVNEYGNLSIAGHNKYDGTMFGKTKNLNIGEIIKLEDLEKNVIDYEIYDKFLTNPNDTSILLTKDINIREVTLITCTRGNKERLIIKAKQKI